MQSRVELFSISSPDYIQVADKPICCPDAQVSKIGLEAIKKQFNFEYFENITVDKTKIKRSIANSDSLPDIIRRLQNPLNDSLVVCRLQDPVGYGLFTQQAIKRGDIIGIYAGEMHQPDCKDFIYGMSSGENLTVAIKKGGLCRFIQHMPECIYQTVNQLHQTNNMHDLYVLASTLGMTRFFQPGQTIEATREKMICTYLHRSNEQEDEEPIIESLLKHGTTIAHANTAFIEQKYNGFCFTLIMATRHIEPREQLGVSYGLDYWFSRKKIPLLFEKQTGEISKWSDVYRIFYKKNADFIDKWSWLYLVYDPKDIHAFFALNQGILQEPFDEDKIAEKTLIVPIANRTLWIALHNQNYTISFLPDEMTPENMKHCLMSPKLLQSMNRSVKNPDVREYINEANKLPALPNFKLFKASTELLTAPLYSNNAESPNP